MFVIGDPPTPREGVVAELLVAPRAPGRGVKAETKLVLRSNDGVFPVAEGVAEPVGVETPLGPDVTDAAPLATWGASIPAGILEEPDHFS